MKSSPIKATKNTSRYNTICWAERTVNQNLIWNLADTFFIINSIIVYLGQETELPAGTHTYPFSCALPPSLPSSFEGEFGHVRYTIKVTLDRPWKFDQDMKMAFTVISPVDLNLNPNVKEPFKLELEKTFCCLCCRSGPLSVVAMIPVTGYVSGQVLPITCECDNASNVGINVVKFILRKKVTFYTQHPSAEKRESKETIAELSIGPVAGGETRTFNQQLEIPALPPTNLVNCGIISLDYDLHIECDVSGPHRNLSGNIPITLGTIPLASFQPPAPYTDVPTQLPLTAGNGDDPSMAPTQPVSPASPPNGTGGALGWNVADSAGAQLYPNIRKRTLSVIHSKQYFNCILLFSLLPVAPPQFVATQFKAPKITGDDDSVHTKVVGEVNFAPRYPTFQFNPTAPPAAH